MLNFHIDCDKLYVEIMDALIYNKIMNIFTQIYLTLPNFFFFFVILTIIVSLHLYVAQTWLCSPSRGIDTDENFYFLKSLLEHQESNLLRSPFFVTKFHQCVMFSSLNISGTVGFRFPTIYSTQKHRSPSMFSEPCVGLCNKGCVSALERRSFP